MTKRGRLIGAFLMVALALGGCATMPAGPSVMVLPPQGKPFEVFQAEDAACRQWAAQQIGISPQETVNQNTAAGAVLGTAIGAGLGAAIGAATGNVGAGAAIGAGSGLLVGSASGANAGYYAGWQAQRRYDIAYQQCMYAKGNLIPGVQPRNRNFQRSFPPPPPPPDYNAPPAYEGSPPPFSPSR